MSSHRHEQHCSFSAHIVARAGTMHNGGDFDGCIGIAIVIGFYGVATWAIATKSAPIIIFAVAKGNAARVAINRLNIKKGRLACCAPEIMPNAVSHYTWE